MLIMLTVSTNSNEVRPVMTGPSIDVAGMQPYMIASCLKSIICVEISAR